MVFVFVFAGLGNMVGGFVEERLGVPGSLGTALYGGSVAVLLMPLKKWATRASRRWLPDDWEDERG